MKGAEDCEEILEALSEFLDSIKLLHEGNKNKNYFYYCLFKKEKWNYFWIKKKKYFLRWWNWRSWKFRKKIEKLQKKK